MEINNGGDKLTCKDRGRTALKRPYCKRYGDYCDIGRLLWCKRDILFGIFMALSIAFFAYGIIYAWQHAEDRVDVLKKVEYNRIAAEQRMDELEGLLNTYNDTNMRYWKWLAKKDAKGVR